MSGLGESHPYTVADECSDFASAVNRHVPFSERPSAQRSIRCNVPFSLSSGSFHDKSDLTSMTPVGILEALQIPCTDLPKVLRDDVPQMIEDFKSILLRLSKASVRGHIPGNVSMAVQQDTRICASINARLWSFFEELPNSNQYFVKLREEYIGLLEFFKRLCATRGLLLKTDKNDRLNEKAKTTSIGNSEEDSTAATVCDSNRSTNTSQWEAMRVPDESSNSHVTNSTCGYLDDEYDYWNRASMRLIVGDCGQETSNPISEDSFNWGSSRMDVYEDAVELKIRMEELQEVKELFKAMETMKEMNCQLAYETLKGGEMLDSCQSQMENIVTETRSANQELARAGKGRSRWWGAKGSGAGAVVGGLIGIVFGPPGMIAGAALGVAGGLAAGKAIRRRHTRTMDRIVRNNDNKSISTRRAYSSEEPPCKERSSRLL